MTCQGIPLAAISTAIRAVPDPTYWLLIDRLNRFHGKGACVYAMDPKIIKVIPDTRRRFFLDYPNVIAVHRSAVGRVDRRGNRRKYFDGCGGVLRDSVNRSMLFAIQWLCLHHNVLIFTGMDMRTKLDDAYVHSEQLKGKGQVNTHNHNHRLEFKQLRQWAALMPDLGIQWLSWCAPGSPMDGLLPRYTPGMFHGTTGCTERPAAGDRQGAGVLGEA